MKAGSKHITILYLLVALLLFVFPCFCVGQVLSIPNIITLSWQTVYVDNVASFKVPAWWVVEQCDGVIYFTDRPRNEEGYKLLAVGVVYIETVDRQYTEPHELINGVQKGRQWGGGGYSNSAGYSLVEYFDHGTRIERCLVDFHYAYNGIGRVRIDLLIWDRGLFCKGTVRDIAKTFLPLDRNTIESTIPLLWLTATVGSAKRQLNTCSRDLDLLWFYSS